MIYPVLLHQGASDKIGNLKIILIFTCNNQGLYLRKAWKRKQDVFVKHLALPSVWVIGSRS